MSGSRVQHGGAEHAHAQLGGAERDAHHSGAEHGSAQHGGAERYAHHGDTMTSVHIGGLRTVMNGDFPVECGDQIQWYWPDEAHLFFDDKGKRIPKGTPAHLLDPPSGGGMGSRPQGVTDREEFHTLQFGQTKDKQKYVPRIKAYVEDPEQPRLYDYMRVFAVAISSARPHEMFDIMIARQAL
jgi:hypothetical protein